MARTVSLDGVTRQIESLLKTRVQHQSAIDKIDATLAGIRNALGGGASVAKPASTGAKRGPKPGSTRRRKRGSFKTSGEESVIGFIKSAGTPTTKEVNQHWKAEGRGGSADNALTKLVKLKKLKRINIKGERGSKYSVL